MSTIIERLLLVQERDRALSRLAREARDIPERKKQLDARVAAQRESLRAGQEELKKVQAAIKNSELEVENRRQKILKLREQQNQVKKNEEYRALLHEIEVLQQEIRAEEDRELEWMERLELARKRVAELEGDLKKEEARVQAEKDALDRRLQEIELEQKRIATDRAALAEQVDREWLARYERIREKRGDDAVVPIEPAADRENFSCGGCHMNLPPHIVHAARKGLSLVMCTYCSRILYWKP